MKLGQFKGYNMEKIYPEKSYSKCDAENSPITFSINSKSISLDQQPEVLHSWFLLYAQSQGLPKYIEIK